MLDMVGLMETNTADFMEAGDSHGGMQPEDRRKTMTRSDGRSEQVTSDEKTQLLDTSGLQQVAAKDGGGCKKRDRYELHRYKLQRHCRQQQQQQQQQQQVLGHENRRK